MNYWILGYPIFGANPLRSRLVGLPADGCPIFVPKKRSSSSSSSLPNPVVSVLTPSSHRGIHFFELRILKVPSPPVNNPELRQSKSVEKVRLQSLRSSRIPPVCAFPKKRLWEPQIPPHFSRSNRLERGVLLNLGTDFRVLQVWSSQPLIA